MKKIVEFSPTLNSFSTQDSIHLLPSKTQDFLETIGRDMSSIVFKATQFLKEFDPVLDRIDEYYKKDGKELTVKINLFYYPAEKYSAEIEIHAPEGNLFSYLKRKR